MLRGGVRILSQAVGSVSRRVAPQASRTLPSRCPLYTQTAALQASAFSPRITLFRRLTPFHFANTPLATAASSSLLPLRSASTLQAVGRKRLPSPAQPRSDGVANSVLDSAVQAHFSCYSHGSPLFYSQTRTVASSAAMGGPDTPRKESSAADAAGNEAAPPSAQEEDEHIKDKRVMSSMSTFEKFKYLGTRYGRFAVVYYLTVGTFDISLYYTLIKAGVDVQPLIDTVFDWFGTSADWVNPKFGTLIAAYSVHKILTIPRVLFVVSTTPPLVSFLKKRYPRLYGIAFK